MKTKIERKKRVKKIPLILSKITCEQLAVRIAAKPLETDCERLKRMRRRFDTPESLKLLRMGKTRRAMYWAAVIRTARVLLRLPHGTLELGGKPVWSRDAKKDRFKKSLQDMGWQNGLNVQSCDGYAFILDPRQP